MPDNRSLLVELSPDEHRCLRLLLQLTGGQPTRSLIITGEYNRDQIKKAIQQFNSPKSQNK